MFLFLQHGFKLLSSTVPEILVQTPLNYDTVKKVSLTLFVQVSVGYNHRLHPQKLHYEHFNA